MKRVLVTLGGFLLLAVIIRFGIGAVQQNVGEEAANEILGKNPKLVEARLKSAARQLNHGLPRPVSGITTLTKVESSSLTLTFFYVIDPPFGEIDPDEFHDQMTTQFVNSLCTEKKVIFNLKNGVTYSYNYEDKEGSVIDIIDFTIDDCEGLEG